MTANGVLCCLLGILLILCAGCTTLAIGDVAAEKGDLAVEVVNSGSRVEAGVQVRVYEIRDMVQTELTNTGVATTLEPGSNTVLVPVGLNPGIYKLNIYVTINSERQTATIRDIVI